MARGPIARTAENRKPVEGMSPGTKYSMLTVLSEGDALLQKDGRPQRRWYFRCDCGNVIFRPKQNVGNGKTKSCGCAIVRVGGRGSNSEKGRSSVKVEIGKRFGMLFILKEIRTKYEDGRSRVRVSCQCDCGEICEKTYYYVRSGRTKDCGCVGMRSKKMSITIGTRFGKLTTITKNYRKGSDSRVDCICDCGVKTSPPITRLLNKTVTSCFGQNCGQREFHGMYKTSEYSIWSGIKDRTGNPKNKAWLDYGGRGIKMHQPWRESFLQFYADMGERPSKTHSIDRIDVNGNYEPENCKWATWTEQANNKRNSLVMFHKGDRITAKQIAQATGLSLPWIYENLKQNNMDVVATAKVAIEALEMFLKLE